jgi:hypothetical protein
MIRNRLQSIGDDRRRQTRVSAHDDPATIQPVKVATAANRVTEYEYLLGEGANFRTPRQKGGS